MLLTLTTTHRPATDLGHLLRKHPERVQSFTLNFGRARVFYPEAGESRCTAALLVEVDPVGLVRDRRGPSGEGGALDQYVNDRPYAASSFLSVAIAEVFGTALSGVSRERPELVDRPLPLAVTLAAVPCRGGEGVLRRLFEPLGYRVEASRGPLDPSFPEWGDSPYFRVSLEAEVPLRRLLAHLYVLIPVLDDDKHYWVGDDEVVKLLRHGEGWLPAHPERDLIARRYLKHRRALVADALDQLKDEGDGSPAETETAADAAEALLESPASPGRELPIGVPDPQSDPDAREPSLNEQRLGTVLAVLKGSGAESVADLGCGEGRLLQLLIRERQFGRIAGMDVSHRTLETAAERMHRDRWSEAQRARVLLLHGSLLYRDDRLRGFDAAAVVEVIEHLDAPRLAAFERVVFGHARPATVVITTPNREYNVTWPTLPAGRFRHRDHRFEWTRAEFRSWGAAVAERHGYEVRYLPVGPVDPSLGSPTQMAVFERRTPS
ncbi:MAG: 3' terminal RNA ribose 2'-O-methyltransferase Hen1 [Verrucomicrobia bacterium]|nr:3' terminal RNA ribose 2'-O-methyltransferase Hen1 [Verrucomicrobiota bacterium]